MYFGLLLSNRAMDMHVDVLSAYVDMPWIVVVNPARPRARATRHAHRTGVCGLPRGHERRARKKRSALLRPTNLLRLQVTNRHGGWPGARTEGGPGSPLESKSEERKRKKDINVGALVFWAKSGIFLNRN